MIKEHHTALAAALVPENSTSAFMLLDDGLRIRAVNTPFESSALRSREELLGEYVFDVFPDNPADAEANGTSQLATSIESALSHHTTDHMPLVRYDISDPAGDDAFLPRLWSASNTAIGQADERYGVLHRVRPVTSLPEALAALTANLVGGSVDGPTALHLLTALVEPTDGENEREALRRENDQLKRALETRDVIGQAKGMIMERFSVDAVAAFAMLRKLSQDSNTRLTDIAERLVASEQPLRDTGS
jgi:hypothetical protein